MYMFHRSEHRSVYTVICNAARRVRLAIGDLAVPVIYISAFQPSADLQRAQVITERPTISKQETMTLPRFSPVLRSSALRNDESTRQEPQGRRPTGSELMHPKQVLGRLPDMPVMPCLCSNSAPYSSSYGWLVLLKCSFEAGPMKHAVVDVSIDSSR